MNQPKEEMSFIDHLESLRWHLMRSVISILVFTILAFVNKSFVFGTLIFGPSRPDFWTYRMFCKLFTYMGQPEFCIEKLDFTVQSRQMTGQFTMHIMSSLVIGLIIAFPYTFWEIWRFIKPGLYPNERKSSRGSVFFVSLLFISGILFGYYMVAPLSINFLASYSVDPSIINEFDITSYVSTLTMLVMACGIMFQLPMIVYFLSKAGLVHPELMKRYRKHSIVVILFLSAILTPPDVISQLLIGLPLMFLYEVSITISARVLKNRLKKIDKDLAKSQKENK